MAAELIPMPTVSAIATTRMTFTNVSSSVVCARGAKRERGKQRR
jgi:hypothetical protein